MAIELKDRIARSFRLLEIMLDQINSYHNHKETMANAGMIVQLGVTAGILSGIPWLPTWLKSMQICACISPKFLTIAAYCAIWGLINVFIRWQLRNRRWAALFSSAVVEVLRRWANSDPTPTDLDPYRERSPLPEKRFADFIDTYIAPNRSAGLYSDVSREGWPNALGEEWRKKAQAYMKEPIPAEWLLSLGSLLCLSVGLTALTLK
jgi:hypothetical protein